LHPSRRTSRPPARVAGPAPRIIDWVCEEPIDGMHAGERAESANGGPERGALHGCEHADHERAEHRKRLRVARDREARVVDRLNGEIAVLRQPAFAGQLECVGDRRNRCPDGEQPCHKPDTFEPRHAALDRSHGGATPAAGGWTVVHSCESNGAVVLIVRLEW
jgi:hypothetical protein